jgi:hypothetical protein
MFATDHVQKRPKLQFTSYSFYQVKAEKREKLVRATKLALHPCAKDVLPRSFTYMHDRVRNVTIHA